MEENIQHPSVHFYESSMESVILCSPFTINRFISWLVSI